MKLEFLVLGKLKESYLSEAVREYEKRLSRFGKVTIVELAPVMLSDRPSEAEVEAALAKEADKLREKFTSGSYKIALCIEGLTLSSEEFAQKLLYAGTHLQKSHVQFVVGSSFGISEALKQEVDLKLSFSKMTFPHQLMRVMLLEQTYRAFSILENGKYHK